MKGARIPPTLANMLDAPIPVCLRNDLKLWETADPSGPGLKMNAGVREDLPKHGGEYLRRVNVDHGEGRRYAKLPQHGEARLDLGHVCGETDAG